ncbi:MAG TPA: hypothetical protein V6C50_14285 [Crinalium sp.]
MAELPESIDPCFNYHYWAYSEQCSNITATLITSFIMVPFCTDQPEGLIFL